MSSQQPSPSLAKSAAYRAADPLFALLALCAEAAIIASLHAGRLPLHAALGLHGVVLVVLAIRLALAVRAGRDAGPLLLLIPSVAIAGPIGAFGGLIIGGLSRRGAADHQRLARWYDRISLSTELDPTARLADQVATGRSLLFDQLPAAPMFELISSGTVSEKQAILGIIARRFHPDYLPTLQNALVSDEPVIRVQAAAVAAKIRGNMSSAVDALLRDASDAGAEPDLILERVREATLCMDSGLMEAKDQQRSARLIDGVMARTLLRLERQAKTSPASVRTPAALEALARHLLATHRFSDYRRLERARRWARRGPWTYRPVRRQREARAA